MKCSNCNRLCNRLVISQAVTFADDTLTINLPAGAYNDREKYCIVVAQTIPATTTIGATVVITIGTDTTEYPLLDACCAPVSACAINTRTRYSTCVHTTPTTGTFNLLEKIPCSRCVDNLAFLPAPAATPAVPGEGA